MDIWCKACGHKETLPRSLRVDEGCPVCSAGVYKRLGKPPGPMSHGGAVLKSLFTLRGAMFVVFVALCASVPDFRIRWIAAALLTLGALKLAFRAMRAGKDGVEFPELSIDELFDARALIPSVVFSILFLIVPLMLIAYSQTYRFFPADAYSSTAAHHPGARPSADPYASPYGNPYGNPHANSYARDDGWGFDPAIQEQELAEGRAKAEREMQKIAPSFYDDNAAKSALEKQGQKKIKNMPKKPSMSGGQMAALGGGVFLILFAPMALVMYLRTGTTFALFFVPQGVSAILGDVKGYLALCMYVWPMFAGIMILNTIGDFLPFFLDPIVQLPRCALLLTAWGFCGLYVRSRARDFDMPVDEEDWVLHMRRMDTPPPAPAHAQAAYPPARTRTPAARAAPAPLPLPLPTPPSSWTVIHKAALHASGVLLVQEGRLVRFEDVSMLGAASVATWPCIDLTLRTSERLRLAPSAIEGLAEGKLDDQRVMSLLQVLLDRTRATAWPSRRALVEGNWPRVDTIDDLDRLDVGPALDDRV